MERDVRARVRLRAGVAAACLAALASLPIAARAATLPDGRAYELVTPGISGVSVNSTSPQETQVASSGSALAFVTNDAPASAPSSGIYNPQVSARGSTGWAVTSEAPPFSQPESGFLSTFLDGFSSDLSQAIVETDQPLVSGAPAGENLYLRTASGGYTLLTDAADDATTGAGVLPQDTVVGASSDLSHIFFNPPIAQLSQDPVSYSSGDSNLYQWANGQLSIVNVLPGGALSSETSSIPSIQTAGLSAVSADGDDVLFQDTDGSGTPGPLYVRADDTTTLDASASQRTNGSPGATQPPVAAGITADGSEVLFTSQMELTNNANTGTGLSENGHDLYEYDTTTGTLTDLTPDAKGADSATGANVEAVVAVDPAAQYIYFVATGDLAPGATSGADNLYVEHDGGPPTYISSGTGIISGSPIAYVTPSGQNLVFESTDSLTGYDNTDRATGLPDSEIYEYSATSNSLVCASCRPSGAPPTGAATIPDNPGSIGAAPIVVSDDGSKVFFQSGDAVVPGASNGEQNVFEYEGGTVSLISPGNGVSPATLIGASSAGQDVFFEDYDDLVPPENSSLQSAIWDARVGGGFPVPASGSGPCTATTQCRGPSTVPARTPTVATIAFGHGTTLVRVERHVVHGTIISVRVHVSERGRLVGSGSGVRTVRRTLHRAATITLRFRLTAAARRALRRRHSLRLTLHVRFRSHSGRSAHATVRLTAKAGHATGHRKGQR